MEAQRKTARGKGVSDGPVLESAIRATADKNSTDKGPAAAASTATPSSMATGTSPPSSNLSAFQDSYVGHLMKVAKDSCILSKYVEDSPAQMVSLAPSARASSS
jgi:hypothetical protein